MLMNFLFIKTTNGQLTQGQIAPLFTVTDTSGDSVQLTDYRSKKVLLAFFRYAGCPVCNFRVHELIEKYPQLKEKGYEVIAVFESSNTTLSQYIADTNIPFKVIGDPSLALYTKYSVEKSMNKMMGSAFNKKTKRAMKDGADLFENKKYKRDGTLTRIPADFIIDEQGVVQSVWYGKTLSDHYPLDNILKK